MPEDRAKKRVAVFGGSFNPPHIGHTEILRWLSGPQKFDEVWVIPCFIHPLGKHLIGFDERLGMCEAAFSKLSLPIRILEVERELGGESRTLRTLEHLLKEYPDVSLSLVVGGDIETQEKQWHCFDKIEELVDIVKIPRGEESHIPDVSSTEIRRRVLEGLPYRDMVEPGVAAYIESRALYRDEESAKE